MRVMAVLLAVCCALAPAVTATAVPGPRLPTGFVVDPGERATKFQIDLSLWVLASASRQSGVYGAYGQRSYWDIDNDEQPFRVENNFRPEFGLVWGEDAGKSLVDAWPDGLAASVAFVHESNGLEQELSRGWNRIVGGLHFGADQALLRGAILGWYAFRVEDTNKDITRDAGDGEVRLVVDLTELMDGSSLWVRSAFSPDARSGYFFTNLDTELHIWPRFLPGWLFPGQDGPPVDLVVEWFVGTGEFLYDYAAYTNRVRVGITLRGGLGQAP